MLGYTPLAQCMLGDGQQAGGTRPNGMHSCLNININRSVNSFSNRKDGFVTYLKLNVAMNDSQIVFPFISNANERRYRLVD